MQADSWIASAVVALWLGAMAYGAGFIAHML